MTKFNDIILIPAPSSLFTDSLFSLKSPSSARDKNKTPCPKVGFSKRRITVTNIFKLHTNQSLNDSKSVISNSLRISVILKYLSKG